MIPTNPMRPLTATAAATPRVAAITTVSRSRATFTPRLAASVSPTRSTSSRRRWISSAAADAATYGRISHTFDQVDADRPPRIQEYTAASVWVSCCSRSEEHTSELQSRGHLVCRLLLEKKKKK